MKIKILTIICSLIFFSSFFTKPVSASYSGVSISPTRQTNLRLAADYDKNQAPSPILVQSIRKVLLSYNSPLAPHAESFAKACIKYNVDCFLVPSIAGVESGFGKRYIKGTHNVWGFGGGKMSFANWDVAIDKVTATLANKYIARGANTTQKINVRYCPPNQAWHQKVDFFRNKFYSQLNKEQKLLAKK